MSDPVPRRRFRFSLRSLILFITLIASGTGLWYRWEPWVERFTIESSERALAFSPGGRNLISIETRLIQTHFGEPFRISCRDVTSGSTDWTSESASGIIFPESCSYSEDGRRFGHRSGIVNGTSTDIWMANTGRKLFSRTVDGSISVDRDLRVVFLTSAQPPSEILEIRDGGAKVIREFPDSSIDGGTLSPDGEQLLTWDRKGEARAWDVASGKLIETFRPIPGAEIQYAEFSTDGSLLLASTNDSQSYLWNARDWRVMNVVPLRHAKLSPTGSWVTAVSDRKLVVRKAVPGDVVLWQRDISDVVSPDATDQRNYAVYGPRDTRMIIQHYLSADEHLELIDAKSGRSIVSLPHESFIFFSPDGVRLLSILNSLNSESVQIPRIRDSYSGALLYELDIEGAEGVFSHDGRLLGISSFNQMHVYYRRRPEYWWGVAWLSEFWLTVVLGVGLVWSVWRDREMRGA